MPLQMARLIGGESISKTNTKTKTKTKSKSKAFRFIYGLALNKPQLQPQPVQSRPVQCRPESLPHAASGRQCMHVCACVCVCATDGRYNLHLS